MTRSQFILGVALLIVSGALAFTISFRHGDSTTEKQSRISKVPSEETSPSLTSTPRTVPQSRATNRPTHDRTHYSVTVSREEDREIAAVIREESLEEMVELDQIYSLSLGQRRELFPYIVAKHPNFRDGILVNGRSPDPLSGGLNNQDGGASFDDKLYGILDPEQQNELQRRSMERIQLFEHVATRFRTGLDRDIESGEMIPEILLPPANEASDEGNPASNDVQTN